MSTLAAYAALHPVARSGSAVSSEAQTVRSAASAVVKLVERSFALFGPRASAISKVWELAYECAEAGWDGEAAEPISEIAAELAVDFIRSLPEDVPMPEFAPEPDGSISVDWIQSRARLFSVSVGTSNRLAYVWLDGADRGHAVARFDGDVLPPRILEGIRRIVEDGKLTVRPF